MSRLRTSRDSDSQVKSGCCHLIRDSLTLLLGFWGVRGRAPPEKKKKMEVFQTAGKALRLSILTPPIYFCYLCSFKSFTVPLGLPFFALIFLRGGGGEGACVQAWVNMI